MSNDEPAAFACTPYSPSLELYRFLASIQGCGIFLGSFLLGLVRCGRRIVALGHGDKLRLRVGDKSKLNHVMRTDGINMCGAVVIYSAGLMEGCVAGLSASVIGPHRISRMEVIPGYRTSPRFDGKAVRDKSCARH
jgi:hypothetical protein